MIACGSYGQTNPFQNLIDTALSGHGAVFISSKPIKNIQLDQKEMETYFYFFRDYAHKVLDTTMLAEIIQNSKMPDTTLWQESELKNYILVNSRDENVSKKYILQKLALTDKKQKKFYSKQINSYNSADPYNRNLFYFSRPVFDKEAKYAVVQWDNAHSRLGGGGGIVLYQLQGYRWKELGTIMNWKY
ncbi:hypothetical protein GCM10023229_30940 [Flavisolibacter ginsenosidimutans]